MSQTISPVPGTKSKKGLKNPPGPHNLSPLGSASALARDPMRLALGMWQQYGDVVRFRLLAWPAYILYHPDHVKMVLQDRHLTYDKQFPMSKVMSSPELFGNGLITSDGDFWLHQRHLMQPSFHRERVAGFGQLMIRTTEDLLSRWQQVAKDKGVLDMEQEMTGLTLRTAGLALFSLDLAENSDTIGRTFATLWAPLLQYINLPFPPLWVPTPSNRRLRASMATLNSIIYDIIEQRRSQQTSTQAADLLGMLLEARDEQTGEGMSQQQVRDELLTLMLAGHETTAATLCWTWYLLSQYPEAERRLHAELETVLSGRVPTVADLDALPYTRMIIQETLRLYPPSFGLTRHAKTDDEIGGYAIAANSMIFVSQYCTHRHPAFWEEPEVFDPERFTQERSASRPRFAYFPFGGGPRQCMGNTFAMMEAELVLATVAQRFALRVVPGHPIEPFVKGTLRPRYGLPMRLHPR